MLALSVKQPWAELIANGEKIYEVRSWPTDYRGPLLIVASSRPNLEACEGFGYDARELPCGVTICTVDLVHIKQCRSIPRRDLRAGALWDPPGTEYAWHLANPRRVEPRPIKGRLRLYDVTDGNIRYPKVPPCAASMGCLCAGHGWYGDPADAPCDTREVR